MKIFIESVDVNSLMQELEHASSGSTISFRGYYISQESPFSEKQVYEDLDTVEKTSKHVPMIGTSYTGWFSEKKNKHFNSRALAEHISRLYTTRKEAEDALLNSARPQGAKYQISYRWA